MEKEVNQKNNTMSRGEFLKRTAVGAAAAAIAIKFGGAIEAVAAPVKSVETKTEHYNNGQYVGTVPPLDKKITWIDTSVGGVMKYWDGKEWAPVKSTWG